MAKNKNIIVRYVFLIYNLTDFRKSLSEASGGAVARGVTVKPTGCGFDPHSRRGNIYLN